MGCGSDKPEPGYYLRGRVVNGATLQPLSKAELTLISGQATRKAVSHEDGTYSVGPIEPSASYRLDASAKGMQPFEFTGVALPALEAMVNDRTLIGDVPLYEADKKSPAFKILVESSDPRMPMTLAAVDFVPAAVGSDPSVAFKTEEATTPAPTPAGTVIGAFAEAAGATLPNHARVESVAFHTTAKEGSVEIPEGALTWGATYQVKVDGGPDFTAVQFKLTPVSDGDVRVVMPTTAKFPTQLPQTTQQYFTGRIYNGVSLERIKDFTMRLEYFDRTVDAKVDAEGRFVIGPLLANADYTIIVEAEGFRNFLSHNGKIPSTGSATVSSLYYDAFLYPDSVKAPAVQARFALAGDTALPPRGTVRFAPSGSSSLFNDDDETPAGVGHQVWTNDEDLQQRVIVRDFTDGKVDLAEGELVLGVTYDVTVYGVPNYAIMTGGSYVAGIDTNPSFTLDTVTESPLEMVSISTDGAALSSSGNIEIRFNHAVVAYPRMDQTMALRMLNDGFSLNSPDEDEDDERNTLVDIDTLTAPIASSYRGITWEISGNRLTLKWDRERALGTKDTGDPIVGVSYGNLSGIVLYSGALPTSPSYTLADLVGTDTLDAQMLPQ